MLFAGEQRIDGNDPTFGERWRGWFAVCVQIEQKADPVTDIEQSIGIGIGSLEATRNRVLTEDPANQQDRIC